MFAFVQFFVFEFGNVWKKYVTKKTSEREGLFLKCNYVSLSLLTLVERTIC